MFAIGYDSRMKHQAGEGAPPTWSGWIDTLGTSEALFIATPAAYTVPGVYGVFGIGTDSALYENLWLDSLGAWGGWEKLGGICREVAAAFGDQLHLFVTGADNSVFHYSRKKKEWTSVKHEGYSIGAIAATVCDVINPIIPEAKSLHVFVIGGDSAIWHTQTNVPTGDGGWDSWKQLSPTPARGLAAVSSQPGRLDVFTIGNDSAIHWKYGSDFGGSLSDETLQPEGAKAVGGLSAVARGSGNIDIFCRMPDNGIYRNAWA
jgi:hypothetical protein